MIKFKLNCSKIDKTKLFKGEKGTYLDAVMIETPNSEYGDYMIVQEVSKEERAAGVKGAILGNAKIFEKRSGPGKPKTASAPKPEPPDDDVPF